MKRKSFHLMVLFLAVMFSLTFIVESKAASKFPSKTITIICPYGAGGGTDALSRKVAQLAKKHLGQEVIVVNKTGGMGAVAIGLGARAKPDGYTVLMATVELVLLNLGGLAPVSYQDFKPLLRVNADPAGCIVRSDSKYKTLADLIADAKSRPGDLNYMCGNFPGNFWLSTTMLEEKAGVKFNKVASKSGAASSKQALLGNHVEAITITPAEADQQFKSGEMRLLAVGDNKRYAGYPDAPTYTEAGYDIEVGTWRGLFVPKKTPAAVAKILEDAFTKAIQEPAYQDFLKKTNFGAGYLNSADFVKRLEKETKEFAPTLKKYRSK